jgi:hypothetical protein
VKFETTGGEMTTMQTVEKESICRKIYRLSDGEAAQVATFIDSLEGDEPNEKTVAALRESADMRNLIGPFHNMEDFKASLLANDDA